MTPPLFCWPPLQHNIAHCAVVALRADTGRVPCAGASLDATRVLDALPEDMPLALAADIAARMMRTAVHSRRSAAITRNLARALHLSTAAQRAEVGGLLGCCSSCASEHTRRWRAATDSVPRAG